MFQTTESKETMLPALAQALAPLLSALCHGKKRMILHCLLSNFALASYGKSSSLIWKNEKKGPHKACPASHEHALTAALSNPLL